MIGNDIYNNFNAVFVGRFAHLPEVFLCAQSIAYFKVNRLIVVHPVTGICSHVNGGFAPLYRRYLHTCKACLCNFLHIPGYIGKTPVERM